jgi:hypothetical protein
MHGGLCIGQPAERQNQGNESEAAHWAVLAPKRRPSSSKRETHLGQQLAATSVRLAVIMKSQDAGNDSVIKDDAASTLRMKRRAITGPWNVEIGTSRDATRVLLHPGKRVTIGSSRGADIIVADPCVSAKHCALDATGDYLHVVDLGSRNGVYVGNARVELARVDATCLAFVIGRTSVVIRSNSASEYEPICEPIPGMVGSSESMMRVVEAIRKHARLSAPLLIIGESGVGKDVAARALHTLSGRVGAFHPINVSTIPETLADSELFGHERGAFTGAYASRCGAFESAHRGTILLDEVGELPLSVQAKLLRVVEDGIVRPVGGTRLCNVDVRIISATWVPLLERAFQGRFRYDLLQRLATVVIEIPALRKRKTDIPALVAWWAMQHEAELGKRIFTPAAMARLIAYDWPGNIRELGSVLYRACVAAECLEVDWPNIDEALRSGLAPSSQSEDDAYALLSRCHGNVSMAARSAGLPRTTFRSRLGKCKRKRSPESKNDNEPTPGGA